ncbi:protein of unknown function [Cyanobium sp. NIES-981]|nr:protein of unknown function [Cyanobium sp. NIES-981]
MIIPAYASNLQSWWHGVLQRRQRVLRFPDSTSV